MISILVTPRVSALAGCDRLVSEPLVIENVRCSNVCNPDKDGYMELLEGDEILRVQGERTQGVAKNLIEHEEEKHGVYLKLVLELLRKEKLYAKFTKSEAVKNWEMMVSTLWIKLDSGYEYEIRYHPAQSEAFKQENVLAERLRGLDQQMERKGDKSLYFMDRIWVPLVGGVRTVIMDEAHNSRYSVHPGAD
ncbi:hypothetical protein Tco_0745798 [Tanacetum coccineum]